MRQPHDEIARQCRFAAEQMRAAGDIEEEPVGRIKTYQRRVAVAPVGDRFEQTAVRFEIGIHHRQRRIACAGVRETEPHLQAESLCSVVQRGDALCALDRGDSNARRVSLLGQMALDPVGREPPEPERKVPPC